MNKNCSLFKINTLSFISLFLFTLNTTADVAYIGDTVVSKVVSRLQGKTLGNLEVKLLVNESDRSASISNYQDWLPSAMQSITASSPQMVILSLGMNDVRLGEYNFPDTETLDTAISDILDKLTPTASVYWIMPHSVATSQKANYPAQREAINTAIKRAKQSGKYPRLFVVDVDVWAGFYQLELADLVNRNKIYLSNNGADIAAEHAILFGQTIVAFQN